METARRVNRVILIVFMIILLPFFLEAKSIVVDGYGETPEQAKYNASVNLNKYVNGEYVTSLTEVSTSDTGNSALNSSFSDSISIVTEGELIGVEYSDAIIAVGKDILYGKYKVTATISDSLSDVYMDKIKGSAKSIDAIYVQNPSTPDSKKARLLNLLTEIRRYDGYKQIAAFLEVDLSELETYMSPITYQSINTELQSFLIEEEVELTNQKNSQSDTFVIAKIKADLEANRKEQEALKAQMENDAKLAEEMALINVENRVKFVLSNSFIGSMNLSSVRDKSQESFVQAVLEASRAWNDLNKECDRLVEQEIKRIDNNLEAELKALENKAYRLVELSGSQPTEDAKRFRNLEINLLKEEKNNEKKKIETFIREGFRERLEADYEAFLLSIKNLNDADFEASLKKGNIQARAYPYDGGTFSWDLDLSLITDLNSENKEENSNDVNSLLNIGNVECVSSNVNAPIIYSSVLGEIEINCNTENAIVYYTTDGTIPDDNDNVYKEPFYLSDGLTSKVGVEVGVINARAYKDGKWSNIATCEILIYKSTSSSKNTVSDPFFLNFLESENKIAIDCETQDVKIFYTTDGTIPDFIDKAYLEPFHVSDGTIISARAYKDGKWSNTVTYGNIIPNKNNHSNSIVSDPIISFSIVEAIIDTKGDYYKVSIECGTKNAIVYYTTDGTMPIRGDTIYGGPLYLTGGEIVKARAYLDGAWSKVITCVMPGHQNEEKYDIFNTNVFSFGIWTVSYESLSNKTPVRPPENLSDISARDEYNKYADDVEYYNRILENIEISPYDIIAKYRLKYILDRDEFYVELYELNFIEDGIVLQEFVSADKTLVLKCSNEKLSPKIMPSWMEIDCGVSESYQDVLSVIERDEKQKAIETKKIEETQKRKDNFEKLKKTVSLDLEGGIRGITLLDGEFKASGSLKASLLVDVGGGFRFGISPTLDFGAFDLSGILMTIDGNFNVGFDAYLSVGMDLGFSLNDALVNFYVGMGIDKVRVQFGACIVGSYTSGAKIVPACLSVRIVDIFK